tara:strand:+ start:158 stop:469 length:312 start_codon:yes stop_codon:yes gene_type:complete
MDKLTLLLEVLKDYDLATLIAVGIGYLFIHKKINIVDRAVNQRPVGSATISDDCITIKSELSLIKADLKHVKKEVDAHREVDESAFLRIEEDIREIRNMKVKR